ncbi:S1/P1 nuclease [Spartinivicinus poritis]|uniref:S1/P1 nuclease n=1 Tax=Spartinivicinus poritis TaxID=2994640 RepID=A0ABT5U7Y4_9GAMM|nr:S1/P1 nuclease [Spartinivicinus sp. A2-2]MDE1462484.1 S1/P1 nuclease [Spartinivicinus sp. A2-2]
MVLWNLKSISIFSYVIAYFCLNSQSTWAFGQNGHRIVAHIAEAYLTPKTEKAIKQITGKYQLAQLATWPDEIKSEPSWDYAKPWHYISIDDNESFESLNRSPNGDILSALVHFERVLTNSKTTQSNKWQALAFYTHLVGDIHQPLHVGYRNDRGGNDIAVKWFEKNSNLHAVWDTELIENQRLSYKDYASFINIATSSQVTSWQKASYLDWAKESKAIRKQAYDFNNIDSDIPQLSYKYTYQKTKIINQRLLIAGVRLAGKLNSFFD